MHLYSDNCVGVLLQKLYPIRVNSKKPELTKRQQFIISLVLVLLLNMYGSELSNALF